MSVRDGQPTPVETAHALLVAYGRFAGQIGLPEALDVVPFGMKTVQHSPQDKTAELLAHLLAGGMHVSELDRAAHPLVRDAAVAQAWGRGPSPRARGSAPSCARSPPRPWTPSRRRCTA